MKIDELPPILLDYSPKGDELYSQVVESFHPILRNICKNVPAFKQIDGVFCVVPRRSESPLMLTEESFDHKNNRDIMAQMAIGDFWEMMNVANILMQWNKDKNAKPTFKITTTHFKAEFDNLGHTISFMFDMEGKWTDWQEEMDQKEQESLKAKRAAYGKAIDEAGKALVDIATGRKKMTMLSIHDGPGHQIVAEVDIGSSAPPIEEQLKNHMHVLERPENSGWRDRLYGS